MKRCVNCGKKERKRTVFVLRPSTPEEIQESEKLAEESRALSKLEGDEYSYKANRLIERAMNMAASYHFVGNYQLEDGALTDGFMKLRKTLRTTDETVPFEYGGGMFCKMRCAEEFAVSAYHAGGYRRKGVPIE